MYHSDMSIILHKVHRFFEIHIAWFFINGFKEDRWSRYLNEKYKK